MDNPFELTMGAKNTGNANIEHEYYIVRARDKYAAFKRIVDFNPDIFGIVFCRTKIETQEIAESLIKDGYNADSLHGDLSQQQRDKVMKRYRERSLQLLIATDVAARGIDVNDVTHVINYSLPDEIENYTHRSGRTARAGKTGVSISIVNAKELGKIRQIERVIGKKFVKAEIPTGFDVCEKQLFSIVHKVHNVTVNEEQIEQYLPRIYEEFKDFTKEDFIKRFASIEFNRFLDYYKNAPDLNASVEEGRNRSEDRGERGNGVRGNFTRLFINLGSVDEFNRGDLLGYICNTTKISGRTVGKIDVKGVYSFFEVQNEDVDKVMASFKEAEHKGRPVRIEISGEGTSDNRGGGERREGGYRGGERREGGGYRGGERREGGGGYRGGERREGGGYRGSEKREHNGGGFRDFSGKPREDRPERRRRF
jgi:ATP-dependent RNA helicase DeaD